MASTNYRYPPAPPNGAGTFSDNLVGNQFVNGSSQMSNGNFSSTNSSKSQSVSFALGGFSEPVTLDSMNIENIGIANAQLSNSLEVFVNYDTSDLSNMVLYGSLRKRLSVAVDNVINSFPAALYVDGVNVNNVSGNTTASNISYDTTTKRTTFRVPVNHLSNPFSIEFTTNGELVVDGISPEQVINNMSMFGNEASTAVKIAEGKVTKLRNLTKEYEKYVITFNNAITTNEYKVVDFTPESITTDFIELIVEGQPFGTSTVTTTTQFYIKPSLVESETQLRSLNGVEAFLMTRDVSPIYTAKFKLVKETDSGKKYYSHKSLTWPMVDDVNLDIIDTAYTTYISELSDTGDELDGIKTNLVSRFLTAPTLKEFDTSDQKVEKTLQIYGRSFDDVKTFVDGIAYMTNVTYDGKKNVPNELTKNFARTLGWSTPSTLNKTSFLDGVLGVTTPQYSGSSVGMTPAELDVELYRRILLNTGYLFKSKGTRKAIEFLLTLFGAPEALIEFNEYVVLVDKKIDLTPKASVIDVYDPKTLTTTRTRTFSTPNFVDRWAEISGGTYNTRMFELSDPLTIATGVNQFFYETGTTYHNFTLADYPIDQSGYPKRPVMTDNYFFQRGAGWFERTEEHKSELITDFNNSVLSGCSPYVVNRFREFTWGGFWTMGQYSNIAESPYLDRFRRFPHMSFGYGLTRIIDDKKSWVRIDDERMSVGGFDRDELTPYEVEGFNVNNTFYVATDSASCDELLIMSKGLENLLLLVPLSSSNTRKVYKSRLDYIDELREHRCFDSDSIRQFDFKNRKANYHSDDERLVLNVKNVDLSLNIGQALVYDVWKQSKDSDCFFSGGTLPSPYSNELGKWDATNPKINAKKINFKEFNENFWRYFIDVKTRMTISDGKTGGYPALQQIYLDYLKKNCGEDNQYTYTKMAKYVKSLGDYWIRIIEQMVPTTTLWTGGIKIENSAFHRDKFVYRCFDIEGESLSTALTGALTLLATGYTGYPASQMGTGPNTMVAPPVVTVGSAMGQNMVNGDTPNQTSTYANSYNINNPTNSGGNILTYGQTTALAGQFQTNGTAYNSTSLFTNRGATDNLLYVFGLNEGGDNNWVLDYDL